MSKHNTGGPAFPNHPGLAGALGLYNSERDAGMTRRDYSAIEAMQSMISGHIAHYGHENVWDYDSIAQQSYAMADAMLKASEA